MSGTWKEAGERRTLYRDQWVHVLSVDVELPDGRHLDHRIIQGAIDAGAVVVVDSAVLLLWRHRFITDTAAPQPALDDALRDGLVVIWQQIAREAGASCVSTVTASALGAALDGLPQVSVVPLPQTPSLRLSCLPSSFTTASTIGFLGDSTTFRDPAAAEATLRRLAEDIREGNGESR